MRAYSLTHLSDDALLRDLASLVAKERSNTAALLAHIAEVDARKLYLPAAHPSMHSYCIHVLGLSDDAAYRRITAARVARTHPAIFEAIADGRLHLTAIVLLATWLTTGNAAELLRAAEYKSKPEIEQLIARHFPKTETMPLVQPIAAMRDVSTQLAREHDTQENACCNELAPARVNCSERARVEPIADQRFGMQFVISQRAYEKLQYAQELLSHQVAPGDIAAIFERSLDDLIANQEKRKFAATTRPQRRPRPSNSQRNIPAHVQRAVWERDGGQCTFVSESGERCPCRTRLECDHIVPVARGGEATVDNLRLRCRPHNQYAAEREFGREFMDEKRRAAKEAVREARAEANATANATARPCPEANESAALEVIPWLRQLGYRADESLAAARFSASAHDASLEQRVRTALSYFRPRTTHVGGQQRAAG